MLCGRAAGAVGREDLGLLRWCRWDVLDDGDRERNLGVELERLVVDIPPTPPQQAEILAANRAGRSVAEQV